MRRSCRRVQPAKTVDFLPSDRSSGDDLLHTESSSLLVCKCTAWDVSHWAALLARQTSASQIFPLLPPVTHE